MLARIQQGIALTLAALFLIAAAGGFTGHGVWPALLVVAIVLGYGCALVLEFMWLVRSYEPDDSGRPLLSQLSRAWWTEVCTAPAVFLWRQPFRSQAIADSIAGSQDARGIILIHGFFCNRGIWNPWMIRFRHRGIPFVAVNLEPLFGSIDNYIPVIDAAVSRIEQATSRTPIIVAHSMGGLAARAWAARSRNADRVDRIITIGTPHRGTLLARNSRAENGRQMRIESTWLASLAERERAAIGPHFICFWSHCDNIVFPTVNATLPDADNRHLMATPHVGMVNHPEVVAAVLEHANSPAG